MRVIKFLFAEIVVLLALQTSIHAQSQRGIPSDGRDFYIGYMAPSIKCATIKPFQSVYALISSYYNCNVTLSYFDHATGKEFVAISYAIQAKNYKQAPLDLFSMVLRGGNGSPLNPDGQVPEFTSCHIHSDFPISVQYYSTGPNSGGMYLALPTGALGTQYVVAAASANPALGAAASRHFPCVIDSSSSEFMIIAIQDNTHVTITPNGLTRKGGNIGVNSGDGATGVQRPFQTTLSRGQVYWVKSTIDDASNDMSGSTVVSDQPVAVIAGCEAMYNGETRYAGNGGDQRDLSVEQMVPVQYWTSVDYASMPFMDSPGGAFDDPSAGDQFKIYTFDSSGTKISFSIDNRGIYNQTVSRFQSPPTTFDNVETGMIASSLNGKKIFVEQYDYRAMNEFEPFPAPSQMNIVPLERYRTRYMWSVPDDNFQVHKKRYINVIARKDQFSKITIWTNGRNPVPLTSLAGAGLTANIPGHTLLQGRRYEISPGCYYATGDSAFGVYQYGNLGLDPDGDLGDNDDDDYYFSYAAPCGQSFGIDGAYSPHMQVDTLCGRWHVTIHDGNPLDHGISSVDILNDPLGILKRRPGTDSGYVSNNVSFDPVNFTVVPGDTVVSFDIKVNDVLHDAWAWVWAVNVAGNDTLIYLHYTAPSLSIRPDSATFLNAPLGLDSCTQFVFKNLGKPGDLIFHVTGYHFIVNNQGFRVTNINPPLPFTMKPSDSIVFTVCFNASQQAKLYKDTLVIETDCPSPIIPLLGTTALAKINTQDYDFGSVLVGHSVCHAIYVSNEGQAPFTLTKDWVLDNIADFSFSGSTKLPIVIQPGQKEYLTFCFTPTKVGADTTIQHWASDIPSPFTHIIKDFSVLSGKGVAPNLIWTDTPRVINTECDTPSTIHMVLKNTGTYVIVVDSVTIVGPDRSEFSIINSSELPPDKPYDMNPNDTIWYDIKFQPDLTKPLPIRFSDRFDTLVAWDTSGIDPRAYMNANVTHADLSASPNSIDFGIVAPGQVTGTQTITITNPGRASLIIQTLTIDTPFTIVQPGSLKQWDTIAAGKTGTIIVQGLMGAPGTDTGYLTITGMTNCPPPATIMLIMGTSFVEVAGTGHAFAPTYICLNAVDSVSASSSGSRTVMLDSVQIVDDPANPGGSGQFQFASGGRLLTPNDTLNAMDTVYFPVIYVPTMKQAVSAQVVFTYDTLNGDTPSPWTVTKPLSGVGLQEHETLSVQNQNPGPYIAQTGTTFEVPVRLTEDITTQADVHTITFDFSYRRDLFNLPSGGAVAEAGYQIVQQSVTDVGDTETVHITVARAASAAFDSAADIVHIPLELVVSRDTNSDFIVSNVRFQNSHSNDICYVLHDTIPGTFTPQDLCGNETIRKYLQSDQMSFSIRDVRPNPATNSIEVELSVVKNDIPMTIELYNMLGQNARTFMQDLSMPSGARSMDLDLSGLPGGTYSLRVTTPGQTSSHMLLIQRQ